MNKIEVRSNTIPPTVPICIYFKIIFFLVLDRRPGQFRGGYRGGFRGGHYRGNFRGGHHQQCILFYEVLSNTKIESFLFSPVVNSSHKNK